MSANIVKVTLEQTRPPVWRRIALPEKITYRDFHEILQIAFGWDNYHLHDFSFPNTKYRVIMAEDVEEYPGCAYNSKLL